MVSLGRGLYRSRQFFTALFGRMRASETAEVQRVLGPNLFPIFATMPTQYRQHALIVYHRVLANGCDSPHVLQAALLHDAGKYDSATRRHVTLPHRVAIVLLKATPIGKRLLGKLPRPSPRGPLGYILYPFYLSRHHAERGARLAAQHGAPQEVVELIAQHHTHDNVSAELKALQAADEQS